jgi:hypothetical protein
MMHVTFAVAISGGKNWDVHLQRNRDVAKRRQYRLVQNAAVAEWKWQFRQ